jgi:hypothetical protein
VNIVNEVRREALSREIYERRRAEIGTATSSNQTIDTDDEDLLGYDPIAPGLPPASSDKRKWWLDNGQPARSGIQPPGKSLVPNPNRPSNPFSPTDEPDWVTISPINSGNRVLHDAPPPPKPRRPNSTAKSSAQNLPPTTNPSAIAVAGLTKNFPPTLLQDNTAGQQSFVGRTQSALPDRRLSTSTTSSTSKKAPPPVARKPVHLAALSSVTSSPTLSTVSAMSTPRSTAVDHTGFPPPPRRSTTTVLGTNSGRREIIDRTEISSPPPPPQSRRSGTNILVSDAADDKFSRPRLPPRRPTDLLGSNEDDESMNRWEALKPT